MSVITIPKTLREKLGDDGVDALVTVINEVGLDSRRDVTTKDDLKAIRQDMATKDDIKDMATKAYIEITKSALELKIEAVKSSLELKIEAVKSEIDKSKAETLKWMFLFWAGQLVAMFTLFKFFVK
ncbi:MAG: hypothetical protein HQL01_13800 [Nitrospirae bacterium]|nr:hypothetical protein [Nitrospirota bacterium]